MPFHPEKEESLPPSDFESKMKQLASERQRTDFLSANIQLQQTVPAKEDVDITKLLQPPTLISASANANANANASANANSANQPALDVYVNRAQQDIIPKPQTTTSTNAYITINGFDRNVQKYKLRYQFAINVTDFMRNNKSIINPQPKMSYLHEQKFGYPYLLLQVDELVNVYDGLNDQVRRSVAQFIYDSSYKCPNGRGYIVLKPAQKERRHLPQPLSSLQRLSFSIIKPNGALFNNSTDSLCVIQVLYEVYNQLYIKITTDKFFDKNEFFIGDNIMFQNVQLTPSPSWTPSACVTSTSERFL
jgi:hypothetical protein